MDSGQGLHGFCMISESTLNQFRMSSEMILYTAPVKLRGLNGLSGLEDLVKLEGWNGLEGLKELDGFNGLNRLHGLTRLNGLREFDQLSALDGLVITLLMMFGSTLFPRAKPSPLRHCSDHYSRKGARLF